MSAIYVEIGPARRIDSHLEEKANAIAYSVSHTPRIPARVSETMCLFRLMFVIQASVRDVESHLLYPRMPARLLNHLSIRLVHRRGEDSVSFLWAGRRITTRSDYASAPIQSKFEACYIRYKMYRKCASGIRRSTPIVRNHLVAGLVSLLHLHDWIHK